MQRMIPTVLQVAIGGAIGASARYGVNVAAARLLGPGFPYGTLIVNILGSFLMGALVVVLAGQGNRMAPLLMTGVLGGFTTFSAFSLDAVKLWSDGPLLAAVYVGASVILSLAALVTGITFARAMA